jgi:hypothetical protein
MILIMSVRHRITHESRCRLNNTDRTLNIYSVLMNKKYINNFFVIPPQLKISQVADWHSYVVM